MATKISRHDSTYGWVVLLVARDVPDCFLAVLAVLSLFCSIVMLAFIEDWSLIGILQRVEDQL